MLDAEDDGPRGVERVLSGDYQLAVLDVMLPGVSGFDLLRSIRAASAVPVLMLTARGDDVDRIVLQLGWRTTCRSRSTLASCGAHPGHSAPGAGGRPRRRRPPGRAPRRRRRGHGSRRPSRPASGGTGRADRCGVRAARAAAARGRLGGAARRPRPGRTRPRPAAVRPQHRRAREPDSQEARAPGGWRRADALRILEDEARVQDEAVAAAERSVACSTTRHRCRCSGCSRSA